MLILELGIIIIPEATRIIDFKKNPKLKEDRFLRYDVEYLIECDKGEPPIRIGIPFSESANLLEIPLGGIQINIICGNFKLHLGDTAWASISKAGFKTIVDSSKIGSDEAMIHLRSASLVIKKIVLRIQKAEYYDQAKSKDLFDLDLINPVAFVLVPIHKMSHSIA
jgi:hypothetical protein